MENPIKAFIQNRMSEQESRSKMIQGSNKSVIFTDADQRKKLNMNSVQSSFNAVDDDTYYLDKLYDMLTTGSYKEKIYPSIFPEVINTTSGDNYYLPSHRYVRLDALRTSFEWFITIAKSNKGAFSVINDYKGNYVELKPSYYLLQLSSSILNNSFVEISNVYDLNSNQYYRVAEANNTNAQIKQIANNLDDENRWKAPAPSHDKVFYVPQGLKRDAEPLLWAVIDQFMTEIRSGDRFKLPTSAVTSSY